MFAEAGRPDAAKNPTVKSSIWVRQCSRCLSHVSRWCRANFWPASSFWCRSLSFASRRLRVRPFISSYCCSGFCPVNQSSQARLVSTSEFRQSKNAISQCSLYDLYRLVEYPADRVHSVWKLQGGCAFCTHKRYGTWNQSNSVNVNNLSWAALHLIGSLPESKWKPNPTNWFALAIEHQLLPHEGCSGRDDPQWGTACITGVFQSCTNLFLGHWADVPHNFSCALKKIRIVNRDAWL